MKTLIKMSLSEFELEKIKISMERFLSKRRPPIEIREQVDLSYKIENQSVIIFEIRPFWDKPDRKIEEMVAKTTFVKKSRSWKIFWQRADLRWHGYEPDREVGSFDDFLDVVDKDEYACFWG